MSSDGSDPSASAGPVIIAPSDGHVVSAVTWFLLVTSGLAIIARLLTKWAMTRRLDLDDAFAMAALVFNIGQSICVSIQSDHGFGNTAAAADPDSLSAFLKASYAGELLFILTLCAAKLSIPVLLNNLTPDVNQKLANKVLAGAIGLWGISSFFAQAFTCSLPATWDVVSGQCINRTSFWYSFSAIHILTDLVLITMPIAMIWPLHMTIRKKILVLLCFGCRLIDIIATAFQIKFARTLTGDQIVDSWKWLLSAQIVTCITIVTSCIPYMRPLFAAFPTGMWMSDEIRRKGNTNVGSASRYGHGSKIIASKANNSNTDSQHRGYILQPVASRHSMVQPAQNTRRGSNFDFGFAKGGVTTSVTATDRRDIHDDKIDLLPMGAESGVLVTQSFSTRQSSIEKPE